MSKIPARPERVSRSAGLTQRPRQPVLPAPATDSLAYALLGAAHACVAVRAGRALPQALAPVLSGAPTPQARGAIQDLAYRTQRGRGRADLILATLADRLPEDPLLRELLVIAVVLLESAVRDPGTAPYPAFTIVDQAVEAAARQPQLARARGFVNAVLRNLTRETARWQLAVNASEEATYNYPDWWIRRVRNAYPAAWQSVLAAGNQSPSMTLRVNRRHLGPEQYLGVLAAHGLSGRQVGPSAVRLDAPLPVERIPGFLQGDVSVQDEAAQRAALLLDVRDGQRVLDACAAPGGKTGHLLEIADIRLTALDSDPARLVRVDENLRRLGLHAELKAGDAAHPDAWWDGQLFDRVLADVPCTASGIVRRHPDIRWLRRDADIAALSRQQQHILDALWRLVAPGGKLLFVTCSIFPDESVCQAQAFAARHADAVACAAPVQLLPATVGLPQTPAASDHDGLFFALFHKSA